MGSSYFLPTQERLTEERRYQIIEKQKELRPPTNTTSRFGVQGDNGFRRDLPSDGHIRQSRVHRRRSLLPLELNERHKLVQWLLLWEFAGGEPAGQVQCAELDGEPPNAECQLCGSPSGLAVPSVIDTEIYRSAGHRMLKRYSPRYAKRS